MITCSECIDRFKSWGDDPRVRAGRYNECGCDYCDKPEIYRQLETQQPPEQVIVHRYSDMSALESDLLQQTARKTDYLLKKLNERKPYSKKYVTYEP